MHFQVFLTQTSGPAAILIDIEILWIFIAFMLKQKNIHSEAVVQRCSVKKVFLKISQNSQENTRARVFFNKVAGIRWLRLSKIFTLSQISYSLSADCLG